MFVKFFSVMVTVVNPLIKLGLIAVFIEPFVTLKPMVRAATNPNTVRNRAAMTVKRHYLGYTNF
ncbi:hypothetical protein EVC09_091 [Rhizobium phage RHph_TM3_3_10]|nr:hypothetical protein EVC09_091 [Rhizobium phage RHph_TM3_3_10]QXV74585.1 hypothetical protein [Rhizobium phage RHEph19]